MIYLDPNAKHTLAAANTHYYRQPTQTRCIDRVLPYHDLIYLVDGGWSFTEQDREYLLARDDVLLLAAGRHHFNRLPCQSGTRTFCLHITCENGDHPANPHAMVLPSLLHIRGTQKIRSYFNEIVCAYWTDTAFREQKLSALISLLLFSLYEVYQETSCEEDLASRAIALIMASPHKRLQTEAVAQTLFVSPKTLNNAMKRKVGVPFYAYQKSRKLEMAAVQLELEPELKLREIATAFGFYDEFHMSKAFKQKYGVSPQEYRRRRIRD